MSVQTKPFTTPEEYLERERAAEFKSEYYNGEIFAMSGGSRNHVMIAGNCQMALRAALKDKECVVFQSDLRVHIPSTDLYTYPDVVVVCGEEDYLDTQKDTLINPVLLIEVLSSSTESYDRGQKFAFYRSIDSLQEYALVAQDRVSVEVFRKNDEGHWVLYEADAEQGTIEMASVGCVLKLDDLYANVTFDAASTA